MTEFLNAIVPFAFSAFTCGTLLTSEHLGARLHVEDNSPFTMGYSFHQST